MAGTGSALPNLGRLDAAGPGFAALLEAIRETKSPAGECNNVWSKQMPTSDKRYVVQTAEQRHRALSCSCPQTLATWYSIRRAVAARQRSQPKHGAGAGSPATPLPIAVAIARQRLTTASFDYWTLADSAEGTAAEAEFSGQPACSRARGGLGSRIRHEDSSTNACRPSARRSLAYDENSAAHAARQPAATNQQASSASPHRSRSRVSHRGHTSRLTRPATGVRERPSLQRPSNTRSSPAP